MKIIYIYLGEVITQQSVTVPLYLERDQPYIDIEVTGNNAKSSRAQFLVDTGGGGFLIPEGLAHELDIQFTRENLEHEGGSRFLPIAAPRAFVGKMPLDLEHAEVLVALGRSKGLFPGHVLSRYCVVFDYPQQQFTLATPNSFAFQGPSVLTPVHARSGFPRIEVAIDGQIYCMLLDTGASCTMISLDLLERWGVQHPDWPRALGAVGVANMGGFVDDDAFMLRIPELKLGPYLLEGVCAVSRPKGTFEQQMAQWMAEPIIGALGNNVLKHFRMEIDYASGKTYFEQHTQPDQHDMDMVGLTVRPQSDGRYLITSLSNQNDPLVLRSMRVGDELLQVDGQDVHGLSLATVIDALRGEPGLIHTLLVGRDGQRLLVQAPTARII